MKKIGHVCIDMFRSRQAQILLPAVMLAPIFILVVYLLFETSKLSMTKVRNQFALDNAAYSQMSSTSAYLNSVAWVNGVGPYRVMRTMDSIELKPKQNSEMSEKVTVFDVFYRAGALPAIGPDHVNAAKIHVRKLRLITGIFNITMENEKIGTKTSPVI